MIRLLGRWIWWIPAELDRRLPHLALEGYKENYLPVDPAAPASNLELVQTG